MASELGWQRFVRRDDPTDVYLARKVGYGYVLRRPGEEPDSLRLVKVPEEFFEAVYEPAEPRSEGEEGGEA